MFKRIVDKNGKPFEPDPMADILAMASPLRVASQSSAFAEMHKVEQLRQSCGVEPGTITFRRSLPFGKP